MPRTALAERVPTGQSGRVSERQEGDEEVDRDLADECAMFVFRNPNARKSASAVRLTHLPTGIVAESSDGRSQLENRDRALRALRDLLDRR